MSALALENLLSRQSVPPRLVGEPAPSDGELFRVFEAAVTAPDHGAVRPWRFLTIRGEARVRLGELFVQATQKRDPETDEYALNTLREKAVRAPLIVAVCAEITPNHPKVPPVEQVVSTAAAAQNMLIALHAMGYGAMMLTGANAYDPLVKRGLGLTETDAIIGFIHVGTPQDGFRAKPRPDARRFVRAWTQPASEVAEAL